MEKIVVRGGNALNGSVEISGMKNAALPIVFACVLVKDKCVIENIPNVRDVTFAFEILKSIGASIKTINKNTVEVDCTDVELTDAPYDLVTQMRASYYLMGAELGRFHRARVALPGGCDFGVRPIDQHIKGFEALGGTVTTEAGIVEINAPDGVIGASIFLDKVSVGATMNLMLASCVGEGTTYIDNAAREPHIVDLANFLNTCGARISGAGTDMIKIRGVQSLHGCSYSIIPDMIEAGTFMIAACATGGTVRINNIIPKHLESITAKLEEVGAAVREDDDYLIISGPAKIKKTRIKTLPYPGFPTDMHPQMTVLLSQAQGVSYLSEGVYENTRFKYVDELTRMGADIKVESQTAVIEGGKRLTGAPVRAVDLRAGVALVIAGLVAQGETEISEIFRIERGYDDIVGKLKMLGADIKKVVTPDRTEIKKAN
jgi:UDP-N-acetylglucosamine 1-carboxyvinyltransferase